MQILRKRLGLIAAITINAVLIIGKVSFFFLTPIYQSSTQLVVNQTKTDQQAVKQQPSLLNKERTF
jgi:capsular polysaccharide biosynthesis protein